MSSMSNRHFLHRFLIIMAVCACGMSCTITQPNASLQKSSRRLTEQKLEQILGTVDPWPVGFSDEQFKRITEKGYPMDFGISYPADSWRRLRDAALYLQECDPDSIVSALIDFQQRYDGDINPKCLGADWPVRKIVLGEKYSKLIFLTRVMFNLPEHAPATEKVRFFMWSNVGIGPSGDEQVLDRNFDGTVNLAWPITWNDGRPRLLSLQTGVNGVGCLYRVVDEYQFFKAHYNLRRLSG